MSAVVSDQAPDRPGPPGGGGRGAPPPSEGGVPYSGKSLKGKSPIKGNPLNREIPHIKGPPPWRPLPDGTDGVGGIIIIMIIIIMMIIIIIIIIMIITITITITNITTIIIVIILII